MLNRMQCFGPEEKESINMFHKNSSAMSSSKGAIDLFTKNNAHPKSKCLVFLTLTFSMEW